MSGGEVTSLDVNRESIPSGWQDGRSEDAALPRRRWWPANGQCADEPLCRRQTARTEPVGCITDMLTRMSANLLIPPRSCTTPTPGECKSQTSTSTRKRTGDRTSLHRTPRSQNWIFAAVAASRRKVSISTSLCQMNPVVVEGMYANLNLTNVWQLQLCMLRWPCRPLFDAI
jgi:hypothetical protein